MLAMDTATVEIIYALLPGFVAAWIFYGLTAHNRPSAFNQIIQALIFTALIQSVNYLLETTVTGIFGGRAWEGQFAFFMSVIIAFPFGLIAACWANNNAIHEWLRCWKRWDKLRERYPRLPVWNWTKRPSTPSQWFSAFSQHERWVVLHLKGGRRLHGWPEEWPDDSSKGHFIIMAPSWLLDNGEVAPLHKTARMLIPATDVEMVEFMFEDHECSASEDELLAVQSRLIREQERIKADGQPAAESTTNGQEQRKHTGL